MKRTRTWMLTLFVGCCLGISLGAAPAPSSFSEVEQAIERTRARWAQQGGQADPNMADWNALFDQLLADLRAYTGAGREDDRLRALGRLYDRWLMLAPVNWQPAAELHAALGEWLRPRIGLAWAVRRLEDTILGLPAAGDPAIRDNRDRWLRFVGDDLNRSLRSYEGAGSVVDRLQALDGVRGELRTLRASHRAFVWGPGWNLETALGRIFDRMNLEVTADAPTLTPFLSRDIVQPGPIYREGQVSYVTPGPKTGFGLLPYDGGIAFYNSQIAYAYTHIRGFQEQIAADRRGRVAAKLYAFSADTNNVSEATVQTVITPSGISLFPNSTNSVSLSVNSDPQSGAHPHVGRTFVSLIGLNQQKITQKVWEGAIGQVQEGVERNSRAEAQEKSGQAQAQLNAQLARYLVGNNTVAYGPIAVSRLALASRPEYIWVQGKLDARGLEVVLGADMPQPPPLAPIGGGVTADVHLPSVLSGLARAFLQSEQARRYNTVLIITKDVPPGTPPEQAVEIVYNADYPTFLRAVQRTRAANNPRVQAIRLFRPGGEPTFGADRQGQLVILGRNLTIEVAAPPEAARGGLAGPPANVYRIELPSAEFDLTFRIATDPGTRALRLSGRLTSFEPGPGSRVVALQEDETRATPLNAFTSTIVLGVLRTRLQSQSISVPVQRPIGGFTVASATDLDPSGWIRLVLTRGQ